MVKMRMTDLKKERIKIIMNNNFKYEGDLLNEDSDFLEIHDYKSDNPITFSKKEIKILERVKR